MCQKARKQEQTPGRCVDKTRKSENKISRRPKTENQGNEKTPQKKRNMKKKREQRNQPMNKAIKQPKTSKKKIYIYREGRQHFNASALPQTRIKANKHTHITPLTKKRLRGSNHTISHQEHNLSFVKNSKNKMAARKYEPKIRTGTPLYLSSSGCCKEHGNSGLAFLVPDAITAGPARYTDC